MMVIYTRWGLKDLGDGSKQIGRQIGPFIVIDPDYKDDLGLLAHEKVHVNQWLEAGLIAFGIIAIAMVALYPIGAGLALAGFGAHHVIYHFDRRYRLDCEVAAYREQAKHYPDDRRKSFASRIVKYYDVDLPLGTVEGMMLI